MSPWPSYALLERSSRISWSECQELMSSKWRVLSHPTLLIEISILAVFIRCRWLGFVERTKMKNVSQLETSFGNEINFLMSWSTLKKSQHTPTKHTKQHVRDNQKIKTRMSFKIFPRFFYSRVSNCRYVLVWMHSLRRPWEFVSSNGPLKKNFFFFTLGLDFNE